MNTKKHYMRGVFMGAVIILILACTAPATPVVIPPAAPNNLPTKKILATATKTPPPPANPVSPSKTPTYDSGPILNFGVGGTPTMNKTATSFVPDFDKVVNFGGGGGGDMDPCAYAGYQPAVYGDPSYGMWWQRGILCVWGAGFGLPFTLKLISPDGSIALTGDFSVNQQDWKFDWFGYAANEFHAIAAWTDNGTRIDMDVLWPFDLPAGNWQIVGAGEGLNASGTLKVEEEYPQIPRILAYDSRYKKEILPVDGAGRHSVLLNPDGGINVMGKNFPANSTVYILLYQETTTPDSNAPRDGILIYKQAVSTNASGYLKSKIPASLAPDKKYLLIGVDANTPLMIDNRLNIEYIGMDPFFIKGSAAVVSSSKIDAKYATIGGEGSVLGKPIGVEQNTADGG
ncbi:MAG: hypothetical protein PHQ36_07510, partial [Anaerolineales bacterium]|nr:hypothetical protein [Anaerolineales bacterium]